MLTVAIITKNRPDFLERLLDYFASVNYKYYINILDSSGPEGLARAKAAIRELEGKLKITYIEGPELDSIASAKKVVESSATPYTVFLPDDDILVPNALYKCVDFLHANAEYSAACGLGVILRLQPDGPAGEIISLGRYRLPVNEQPSAAQRITDYFNHYSPTLFCVARTDIMKQMYKDTDLFKDNSFGGEIFQSSFLVVCGKVKQLDCLYLVRQDHKRRYMPLATFDWLTQPQWQPSYTSFFKILASKLSEVDGIKKEEAERLIRQAFSGFLLKALNADMEIEFINPLLKLKYRLKNIPLLGALLHYFKTRVLSLDKLSQQSLLSSYSFYHGDFMPIYRLLTRNTIS